MGVWVSLIGLAFTIFLAIVGFVIYISKMRNDIDNNNSLTCQEINNLKQAMQVRNEFNDGIFKEIKQELRDVKELMMEIIQKLPKRSDD